ncbi:MAG: phage tail tape measure protein family, partial [Thermoleophilia bacterium]|nr:phage tail tape measure protein family [Thermoleophilia bacterium]
RAVPVLGRFAAGAGMAARSLTILGAGTVVAELGWKYYQHRQEAAADAEQKASKRHTSTALDLAQAVEVRQGAAMRLDDANRKLAASEDAADRAADAHGKKSPEYAAAMDVHTAAVKRQAAAQQEVNTATKDATNAVAPGAVRAQGAVSSAAAGRLTAGEEATLAAERVRAEERVTAATEKQLQARVKLNHLQNDRGHSYTDPVSHETSHVANSPGDMRGGEAIADANKKLGELNRKWKDGKVSADEFAKGVEHQNGRLRDAQKEISDARAAVAKHTTEVRKAQVEADKLGNALGIPSKAARASARDMLDSWQKAGLGADFVKKHIEGMARTPMNMRVAKALVTEMSSAQRVAAFGTSNVNQIIARIGTTPPSRAWVTAFAADYAAARATAQPINVPVTYRISTVGTIPHFDPTNVLGGGKGKGHAAGGAITGPGTGTSDSILARLSNGEHVLTAREVAMMGGHAAVERWRAAAVAGDVPKYAAGGAVARKGHKPAVHHAKAPKPTPSATYLAAAELEASQSTADIQTKLNAQRKAMETLLAKEKKALQVRADLIAARNTAAAKLKGMPGKTAAQKTARGTQKDKLDGLNQRVVDQTNLIDGYRRDRGGAASAFTGLATNLRDAQIGAITSEFDRDKGNAEQRLAAARLTPGTDDDTAAEADIRNVAAARAAAVRKILSGQTKLLKDAAALDPETRRSLQDDMNSAVNDSVGPDAGNPALDAFSKMQERWDASRAELDAGLAAAEATEGKDDDRLWYGRIEGLETGIAGEAASFLSGAGAGLTGSDRTSVVTAGTSATRAATAAHNTVHDIESEVTPDMQAQKDQMQRKLDVATEQARLSEASLGALSSSGDIGYGGGYNALAGGAGARPQVIYNINALSGYDPAVQGAMAAASNGGNAMGGNADRLYSGRS